MASTSSTDQQRNDKPYVMMALQGGGALGAFQVGAYQALSEKGYEPDWVAGISIGAINASIIAGNPQKDRLKRLNEFWSTLAGHLDWWECVPNYSEKFTNLWKVWLSMVGGVPGFFRPNFVPPQFAPPNSPQAGSLYNTQKLKTTLQSLIDFELLNNHESPSQVRLSLGATQVSEGTYEVFESFGGKAVQITVDHIMASGAFAPWLPGVVISGRLYWDGGATNNSALWGLITHLNRITAENRPVVVFVINLWGGFKREPKTFDEVCWKFKEIQYSSRVYNDMAHGRELLLRERAEKQIHAMPPIDFVHVSYPYDPNEVPCGDALFSRTEIERRIKDGYAITLDKIDLWRLQGNDEGVKIHRF
jgi:NTE family protein